jgi:hypothetical protein
LSADARGEEWPIAEVLNIGTTWCAFAFMFSRNVERFRGGLVFKTRTLLYHSNLGPRVIKKK